MKDTKIIRFEQAISNLNEPIHTILSKLDPNLKEYIQEIRLRVNKPLAVTLFGKQLFVDIHGKTFEQLPNFAYIVKSADINEIFKIICRYSVYSYQKELAQGFITLRGGHRVGISGTAVMDQGVVSGMKNISSLNIRIAREIIGCATALIRTCFMKNIYSMMIAGIPSSGKTTMLRDLARQLSNRGKKVTIVDERFEIASEYNGIPQNDVGLCTDVISGYPKHIGILMAIRTLSPDIIICDEIGGREEMEGIQYCMNSGVSIITTIHARNIEEILKKRSAVELMNTGAFEKVVFLDSPDKPSIIKNIVDIGEQNDKNNRYDSCDLCLLGDGIL